MSSSGSRSRTRHSGEMTKATTPDNSLKGDKKKKSIIPKIFGTKGKNSKNRDDDLLPRSELVRDIERRITSRRAAFLEASPLIRKSFSDRHTRIEGLNLSNVERPTRHVIEVQEFRIFVATWNVGGKAPSSGLNLEDFLQVEGSSDIYVLGFQETVPLNAGNVLVIEDSEPAAKWLSLISQALNKPTTTDPTTACGDDPHFDSNSSKHSQSNSTNNRSQGGLNFFHKPSLKVLSRSYRADNAHVKSCNCRSNIHSSAQCSHRSELRELLKRIESGSDDDDEESKNQLNYCLVSSKQMVGIFLSIWVRTELVRHVGHLRVCCVGRGIMGCLGNKGCISVSMSLHQTSFCFVCSHLASGEKEGDELRRNSDVAEILKNTQFSRICKFPGSRIPERILEHDRVIWLGDLNYRLALSYTETRTLLDDNDWDALLERDQLKIERGAGRVFSGWNEGRIFFAPTYKYSHNSDAYAGETVKSKKKRRTPAWCDRILWYGEGIEQLSYIRGESRFSDHRPVCAVFTAEVQMQDSNHNKFNRKFSSIGSRIGLGYDEVIQQRHSFYEY
ncbi:Type I inositol 1,4,5-trisphosphate 5-phosphatase CVP2 [Acorus gramineus]|uniref:Type I inositol 1,4,5-trisphosphate 5-phosphatase CVP2 n=1 Tax=Acorus gramineus TaxID=55184 RepID=A0AAV9AGX8_ACOGR|nr:Type I inositol 1,4,5-trisphosphate 5-phosphatase CVP2 [Acorus gramineus]